LPPNNPWLLPAPSRPIHHLLPHAKLQDLVDKSPIPAKFEFTTLKQVMKPKLETIDDYVAGFMPEVRDILEKVRQAIRSAAPDARETIKYQIPTFTLNGNLVHFAAFKNHIGFYPAPSGIAKFKKDLAGYKAAKGSVQFPLNQPMPLDLIAKIVRFRVKENLHHAPAKSNAKRR
jgi:uncharacterized protein YdhG (YjbR/CyaY superfamily)